MKKKCKVILTTEQIKQLKKISKKLENSHSIEVFQSFTSGIGPNTYVKVSKDVTIDITDHSNW